MHFLASYDARSRDQYGRTQRILGAVNGIERSEDRSSRVYFVLRFSRKRRASLEAPHRCFYTFRLSPILLLIPRQVSVIKNFKTRNYFYLPSRITNMLPCTRYLNEAYISRLVRFFRLRQILLLMQINLSLNYPSQCISLLARYDFVFINVST